MLLDKRRAGGKNRRKGEKQAPHDRSEAGGNKPCNHSHRSTESEPDQVFIPMGFAQSRQVELNNHGSPSRMAGRANATANQTMKAAVVAVQDGIMNLLSTIHTVQL